MWTNPHMVWLCACGVIAHVESSGAAQDVTQFHQFPANWLQTGSEQSTGLGPRTDYTYTELSMNMAYNSLFIDRKTGQLSPGRGLLSSGRIKAANRRQDNSPSATRHYPISPPFLVLHNPLTFCFCESLKQTIIQTLIQSLNMKVSVGFG